ncbi:ITFG2 [Lepeophtheirus salmonis]|uniref:ITFG2 n=1 Tax=Lepeophtheirus salmonis TaxID=72036 RepID=A0A7R8CAR9_LEPSM|nr:ITFG2 [Lepeophtheirus salmonis]CAF2753837.1 ITFG2 [Lepeophtheirus salmonis]
MNTFRLILDSYRKVIQQYKYIGILLKTCSSSFITFTVLQTTTSLFGYPARVQGISMCPSLNKSVPKRMRDKEFKRGEIVIFVSPRNPKDIVIKRIIALQGDTVLIEGQDPIKIERGYCWVEGDNSLNSIDSTKYGQIPELILQRICWGIRVGKLQYSRVDQLQGIGKNVQNLGHITAVRIGCLLNNGLNVLLVISVDGWCYVFSFFEVESDDNCDIESLEDTNGDYVEDDDSELDSNKSDTDGISVSTFGEIKQPSTESYRLKEEEDVIKYIYKQRVPANVKDIILDDVDGDGKIELLVVLTDRVIRTYRWEFNTKYNGYKLRGRLHSLNKWDFAGQIGSVALHNIHDSVPTILVTQPGGSCMRIHCAKEERESTEGDLKKILSEDNEPKHSIRNLNVSSEIIGNFGSYYAMATLDGSIIVMDNGKIVKKIKLNHQLFCLNRLSLSPNGLEELIVSSWDGHTYIISQDFRILEFHLGESIAAFKTGHLTLNGRYVPAFAFVTFFGQGLRIS